MSDPDPGRARAESFGANAVRYDRSRPSYPAALVDDLMAAGPRDVLDVGCGTGIAGRLFAARGCRVLGVEADPRMAAVARGRGLDVEIARFEDWDPAGRQFDLLISGQAWHWVAPRAGVRQAALALRPGGQLAAFWNGVTHSDQVLAILEAAYLQHAPDLIAGNIALGTFRTREDDQDHDAICGSGLFDVPSSRRYEWDRVCTPEQWLDGLSTYSNHLVLTTDQLSALLETMRAGLAEFQTFTVRYDTSLILARRR